MADVRGGKPVKLSIKGEAVLPAVDIKETQLDFGEVYTGVTARIPITIINTTPVLAGQPLINPSVTPSSPPSTSGCTAGGASLCVLVKSRHSYRRSQSKAMHQLLNDLPALLPVSATLQTWGHTNQHAPCNHQDGLARGCLLYVWQCGCLQVCQWTCKHNPASLWTCPRKTGRLMSMRTAPWCVSTAEDLLAAPGPPAGPSKPPPIFIHSMHQSAWTVAYSTITQCSTSTRGFASCQSPPIQQCFAALDCCFMSVHWCICMFASQYCIPTMALQPATRLQANLVYVWASLCHLALTCQSQERT